MARVLLNGENVNFEGPPPSSIAEVWALLEGYLGQSGSEIDEFLVDGEAWTPDSSTQPESYETIEANSLSAEHSVARIATALLAERPNLLGRWEAGSSRSLRQPWSQFLPEGLEILNATEPVAQSVGLLVEYAKQNQLPWSSAIEESAGQFNAALSSLMDAIEAGDCVAYSDGAATVVPLGLNGVYDVLSRRVLPASGEKNAHE